MRVLDDRISIFINGKIRTLDASGATAEAVALRNDLVAGLP